MMNFFKLRGMGQWDNQSFAGFLLQYNSAKLCQKKCSREPKVPRRVAVDAKIYMLLPEDIQKKVWRTPFRQLTTSKKSDQVVHQSSIEDQDEGKGLSDVRLNIQKHGPCLHGENNTLPLIQRFGFNLLHSIQELQDLIPCIPS